LGAKSIDPKEIAKITDPTPAKPEELTIEE